MLIKNFERDTRVSDVVYAVDWEDCVEELVYDNLEQAEESFNYHFKEAKDKKYDVSILLDKLTWNEDLNSYESHLERTTEALRFEVIRNGVVK